MKSVHKDLVFRQYLSNLPSNVLACPLMNYDAKKLTDFSLVKIFILANLSKWDSQRTIETGLYSNPELLEEIGAESISHSTIGR